MPSGRLAYRCGWRCLWLYRALFHRADVIFNSFFIFCLTVLTRLLYSIAHPFVGRFWWIPKVLPEVSDEHMYIARHGRFILRGKRSVAGQYRMGAGRDSI